MSPKLAHVLAHLRGVRPIGKSHKALCPAHKDKNPSLSIGEENGKILLHCFAGCKLEDICKSAGIEPRDLFAEASPSQNACNAAALTVEEYAEAKRLPVEFLKNLRVSTIKYQGRMVVRIPYLDETGSEVAIRFRMALTKSSDDDNRFRWKRGSKPHLYGLWRKLVPNYRILCEGESDCHTLWHHGFPALGVPGATNWNEGRDAAKLDRIARIYVVIEPDKGGAAVESWLAKSKFLIVLTFCL
jgi:putative DNA primase/helicase